MSRHELDARNLMCPMPVIRAQNRVAELKPGDILEVTATDPGALHDIPAWCRVHGHHILQAETHDGLVHISLRVAES